MDQLTQGQSSPQSGQPVPQPGPQQIPPAVTPPVSVPPAATSVQPASTQPVDVAPASPSKLKNPKLWIGAGVLLLVVVVGAAIFLGKSPLFTGKVSTTADKCANLEKDNCSDAKLVGICEWTELDGIDKCQAIAGGAPPDECTNLSKEKCKMDPGLSRICEWVGSACRAIAVAPPEPPPPPSLPDLVAESPSHSPQEPTTESSISFTATIKNQGTASAARGFRSKLYLDWGNDGSIDIPIMVIHANALDGNNATTSATFTNVIVTGAPVGTHSYRICADDGSRVPVAESDETNNCTGTQTFVVSAFTPPLTAEQLEQLRNDKLAGAQILSDEACSAAQEASSKWREFPDEAAIDQAAKDAKKACEDTLMNIDELKNAKNEDDIHRYANNVQAARDSAVAARDQAVAVAATTAAQLAAAGESDRLAFEQRCGQEKGTPNSDGTCTLIDGTKVSNIAELEGALGKMQEESARRAFQEFCEGKNLEWKDNQCIFNDTVYNNRQALEVALAAAGGEDQKKKDCKDKNKDKDPKTPEWRWDKDKKECVGGKVTIADVKECPQGTILYEKTGKKECRAQDELCQELAGGLTSVLNEGKLEPGEVPEAVDELNNLTDNRCGFTAAQFLAPFEEEKAKNACAAKDQDVWEWDAGGKICKNKQEGRILELESLVASLQGQLANAQGSNSDAQINALAQQIATLNSQINELRGAAGEPIVITVVAPPAPAPAPAPAAPPAAPPSGGGGGEIVAVATPEVKKEEKKDSKKKKDKKATSGTASVETAAASAPAVSDSGAAAGVVAVQPAATGTAAAGSAGSAPATSAAASTRVTHGAFIQGRTGPGVLIYPLAVIGANGVYYFLRKRRKK